MQTPAMLTTFALLVVLAAPNPQAALALRAPTAGQTGQSPARQLLAVRGVITKKLSAGKGLLQITVKPAKDFAEVTVTVRENDRVGSALTRTGDTDLLGLAGNDAGDSEPITAAELEEGDLVSVIYDPQLQNRALEIYLH
jgi:hypothetical protein